MSTKIESLSTEMSSVCQPRVDRGSIEVSIAGVNSIHDPKISVVSVHVYEAAIPSEVQLRMFVLSPLLCYLVFTPISSLRP